MRNFVKSTLLGLTLVSLIITGCKKDDPKYGTLQLHIHSNVDTAEIDPTVPNPINGRQTILSSIRYYISGIKMTKTDGSVVSVAGNILYQTGTEDYTVGAIPVGTYKSIAFNIGVQQGDNHSDPAGKSSTDVLASQNPTMHYASTYDGYYFMAIKGLVDSNNSNTPNKAISYVIGTDSYLKTVTLGDHSAAPFNATYTFAEGKNNTVHILGDFKKLFANVDLNASPATATSDIAWVAKAISDNIPTMFRYEE